MLNFNLFESVEKDPDGDLNTYHVNLQLWSVIFWYSRNIYLNTSHVNLQLYSQKKDLESQISFKYISC